MGAAPEPTVTPWNTIGTFAALDNGSMTTLTLNIKAI